MSVGGVSARARPSLWPRDKVDMAANFGLPYNGGQMDRGTICQLACRSLGNYDYVENAATLDPCDMWFDHVMRFANAYYDWGFCAKRAVLKSPQPHVPQGRFLYRLPVGCLKVTDVRTLDGARKVRDPQMMNEGLTVGEDGSQGVVLDYQCDVMAAGGEATDRNPQFCEALVCLLAAKIAPTLTGRADIAQVMDERGRSMLGLAIAHDKQQDWSNAKSPIDMIRRRSILPR